MKTIINRLLLVVTVLYGYTATASSQNPAGTNTAKSIAPISVSVETGRYEPAPSCKKDVDGCFPTVWTSTSTFTLGMHVWIRATFTNHSNLTAYADEYPEIPAIPIGLVEERTGLSPRLTSAECRLRQNACTPAAGGPAQGQVILSGFSDRWIIPPGGTHIAVEELTREFVLTEAGGYSITAAAGTFYLTTGTGDKIGPVGPVDNDFVKTTRTKIAEVVHFAISN